MNKHFCTDNSNKNFVNVSFKKNSGSNYIDIRKYNDDNFDSYLLNEINRIYKGSSGNPILIDLNSIPKGLSKNFVYNTILDNLDFSNNIYFTKPLYHQSDILDITKLDREVNNVSFREGSKPFSFIDNPVDEIDFASNFYKFLDKKRINDYVTVYKDAGVSRFTYSKLISGKIKATKPTMVAFGLAMKLNLDEMQEFLNNGGYALSKLLLFDKIIIHYVKTNNYDMDTIGNCLQYYNLPPLGEQTRER